MKKTIRDVELNNKVVLIRVDFNVPMKNGVITNDNRIVQALPTIQYALDQNAKVVLFSHLGMNVTGCPINSANLTATGAKSFLAKSASSLTLPK